MPTSQTIEYPTVVPPATTSTSQSQQWVLNASSCSSSRSSLKRPFTDGSRTGSLGAMGTIDSARTSVTQVVPYDEPILQGDSTDAGRVDLAALGLIYEGMVPTTSQMSEVPGPSQLLQLSSMANGRLSPIPASPAPIGQDALVPLTLAPPLLAPAQEPAPPSPPVEHQTQSTTLLLPQQQHEPQVPQTPQTYLTFLLLSGQRKIMSFDPETTIGRVKDSVWNAWPSEWQQRPPSPSYLRILYLGKMLQEEDTLTTALKVPMSTPPCSPTRSSPPPHSASTIVHLCIRPFDAPGDGEDDAIKKKWGRPRSADSAPPVTRDENSCCCVIC